ncbi:MAG: ATP-dependent helicase UvrD/PcrA [Chloroflexota bacterium]|nr:ATP-dependent helicase UvrD/PcrA [Chloroflexota bacterium]
MPLPPERAIAAALLAAIADGGRHALRELRPRLAAGLRISPEDLSSTVGWNPRETRFAFTVGHARTLLTRHGLAAMVEPGVIAITGAGHALLAGAGSAAAVEARLRPPTPPPAAVCERPPCRTAPRAIPGPAVLGRGVVIGPRDPVPGPWRGLPEVAVGDAELERPTPAVERLHLAWVGRRPVVVRLGIDRDRLRAPRSWQLPLWELGAGFVPWTDRLAHLVWSNNYDARGGRGPVWWWSVRAADHGAERTPEGPADVRLPGGGPAWIDGGPRRPLDPDQLGAAVVHFETVRAGWLRIAPPPRAPRAELAPDQRAAVAHPGGPARIIAPAGSGKTRVLTERLRHLVVDRGYERETVLALAYNRRAHEEMARRCAGFGPRTQTVHALGWAIVRDAEPQTRLVGDGEVREILARHCPPLDRRANSDPLGPYLDALQTTREGLRDPGEVESGGGQQVSGFARAFDGYRAELRERGLADFDEQVYRACELLLDEAALRQSWQGSCRHLLVDEFQDLTPLRLLLIRVLAAPALDVFAVGDDDQVVYGYTGADPRFLVDFGELFGGATEYALEVNHRCPPAVVRAASTLLGHNRVRVPKTIRAGRAGGHPHAFRIRRHPADGGAAAVVAAVSRWIDAGAAPASIAVLARVNAALLAPQLALGAAGVPLVPAVRGDVLRRTGVRSALALLRLGADPERMSRHDIEEIARRPLRGLGREFFERLGRRTHWSTRELRDLGARLDDRDRGRLWGLIEDVGTLYHCVAEGTTASALAAVRRIGLERAMQSLDAGGLQRESHLDDLDALEALATLHTVPASFEAWLRDHLGDRAGATGVTLSTVHRVKGQEWDLVCVAGVSRGMMPHRLAADAEEERRILHVALTRAREQVIVLTDATRPSPFVSELLEAAPAPDFEEAALGQPSPERRRTRS